MEILVFLVGLDHLDQLEHQDLMATLVRYDLFTYVLVTNKNSIRISILFVCLRGCDNEIWPLFNLICSYQCCKSRNIKFSYVISAVVVLTWKIWGLALQQYWGLCPHWGQRQSPCQWTRS